MFISDPRIFILEKREKTLNDLENVVFLFAIQLIVFSHTQYSFELIRRVGKNFCYVTDVIHLFI